MSRRSFPRFGAIGLLVIVVIVTGGAPVGSAAGPAATLFVSPTGSGGACTRSAPCASFANAYALARPGQVVEVAGGEYPPQRIPVDSSKTSPNDVVFQPAAGQTVTIGCPDNGVACIDIFGDHVTIRAVHVASMPPVNGDPWQGSVDTERGSDDVTLINIDAGSLNAAASNMTVIGGDWGPSIDPHNMRIVDECVNCTWDGLLIHDFAQAQGGHFECLTFEGGTNVTIRNSEFRSCAIFSIFAKPGGTINGALIENNVFWNPQRFFQSNEIKFTNGGGGTCANIVIRYNVISDDVSDDCGAITVLGNIQLARQQGCGPSWDYNVFVNVDPCGGHALRVADVKFKDAADGDFHLQSGSPAIGRGSLLMYPARDKDGRQRPAGAYPDAGSYEAPPLPRPKDAPARVPSWASSMYDWLAAQPAKRGARPRAAPKHLPTWFADWRRWRNQLAHM